MDAQGINGGSRERGFAMVLALFVVVLLLAVGIAMLQNAQNSASDTLNTEQKNQAVNAAMAGLNAAVDLLDRVPTTGDGSTGSKTMAQGYTYSYEVVANNFYSTNNQSKLAPDPNSGTTQTVTVPAGQAFIIASGKSAAASRTANVEAMVKQTGGTITFPNGAINAGGNIDGNWNSGNCIGVKGSAPGKNDANVHANGNITANACFVEGKATASGTVTGNINANQGTANGVPQVSLPTSQMDSFVSTERAAAQKGSPNLYIANGGTLPTAFTCTSASGCVVFVDGPVHLSGKQTSSFMGTVTVVINGDFSETGQAVVTFQKGSGSLLAVNGNADVGGNGYLAALMWAKGNTKLHGNGAQFGALVSGGDVTFAGGGNSGGFSYDPQAIPPPQNFPSTVIVITYGEY